MAGRGEGVRMYPVTSTGLDNPAMNVDTPAGIRTQPAVIRQEFDIEERQEVKKREKWSFNLEFILACVAHSVVFVNIWRLPYVMVIYGGVCYLFVYIFFVLLIGVPMVYLHTCLGQFWGKGPFHIFKISPIMRGLGVSMVALNFFYVMYSSGILAWFAYYGVNALFNDLPWAACNNVWNTQNCGFEQVQNLNTSFEVQNFDSPAKEFFLHEALRLTDGMENLGVLRWQFVVAMLIIFGLIFAASCFGMKVLGKILIVTVCVPILILFALFMRGVTLPGALTGIRFLLYPDVTAFQKLRFWVDALRQALWTVGSSLGVFQTLASYNNFNAPCLRNSFVVMTSSIAIGLLSGLAYTSLVGVMATSKGMDFLYLAESGIGMGFMSMPGILSTLQLAQLWSFLFFLMMFLIGFSNQLLLVQVFITTIMDILPKTNRLIRAVVTLVVCVLLFVVTLPFLTEGGLYLLTFFDSYLFLICTWLLPTIECIVIVGFYGLDQLSADIKMMTGLRPPIVFKFLWTFIIPTLCLLCLVWVETQNYPLWLFEYRYPDYINSVGHFFSSVPLYPILIFAIVWCVRSCRSSDGPLQPDIDCRPATDKWMDYELNQRKMERSVLSNIQAVVKI